jgi:signal transduction histidine kinase
VKNIVLAHGGQISLRSTPGEGATFIIRLPVTQNEIATAK